MKGFFRVVSLEVVDKSLGCEVCLEGTDGFNVLETITVITVVIEEGHLGGLCGFFPFAYSVNCVVMGIHVYLKGDFRKGSVWKWCECEVTVVRSC